jgi:hypothetical protein
MKGESRRVLARFHSSLLNPAESTGHYRNFSRLLKNSCPARKARVGAESRRGRVGTPTALPPGREGRALPWDRPSRMLKDSRSEFFNILLVLLAQFVDVDRAV